MVPKPKDPTPDCHTKEIEAPDVQVESHSDSTANKGATFSRVWPEKCKVCILQTKLLC